MTMNAEEGILWSCVCRDKTILAEAGDDIMDGEVTQLAQNLIQKKPTPGWEFQKLRQSGLHGIKFHVYEKDDFTNQMIIWVFCCIYDSTVQKDQAQSFIEKIIILTQMNREEDRTWRKGDTLAAQASFAPILYQRMQEVSYMGRLAMVNSKIDNVKEVMAHNIDLIMERDEKLQAMDSKASDLNEMSKQFKKGARKLKRFKMWQNAKYGVVMGTAVTAGVAIIVVPPLVAIL